MGSRKHYGKCHLCGAQSKLSYEHVPPAAAFNSNKAFMMRGAEVLGKDWPWDFTSVKTWQLQRGIGFYRLCGKCNNDTGGKYASAFVELVKQGFESVGYHPDEVKQKTISIQFRDVYPLRVLKEVVCMFCTINPPELADIHQEFRNFVLDQYVNTSLPPSEFALSIYLLRGPFSRNAGMSAHITGLNDVPKATVLSELSAPPFGFLLQLKPGQIRPMSDILSFQKYAYDDCVDLRIEMPVYDCHTPLPGDFRKQEEIMKSYLENKFQEMIRKQAGKVSQDSRR